MWVEKNPLAKINVLIERSQKGPPLNENSKNVNCNQLRQSVHCLAKMDLFLPYIIAHCAQWAKKVQNTVGFVLKNMS